MANINSDLDFLIIGVGKSGTTSLADYISQHPDIIITTPKEPWFFDTDDYHKGMTWYWSRYLNHYAGEKCVGEASSQTLFVPYAAKRLYKTVPDAKLIVVLRNPVERAYSDWWMKYCKNMETDDFETAIDNNLRQIESGFDFSNPLIWQDHIDSHGGQLKYKTYVDYGHYATQLERYLKYFRCEQILIILSDELFDNTIGTLRKVWQFLDVENNQHILDFDLKQKNTAKSQLEGSVRRSIANIPFIENTLRLLPPKAKNTILSTLNKLDIRNKPAIPDNVKFKLEEHYKTEINTLESMIDRDLSIWLTKV